MTFLQILTSQQFTELETVMLNALDSELQYYYGEEFTDVDANDLAKRTKLPIDVVKGVIGSLVSKNVVTVHHFKGGDNTNHKCFLFVNQEDMVR